MVWLIYGLTKMSQSFNIDKSTVRERLKATRIKTKTFIICQKAWQSFLNIKMLDPT